MSDRARLGLLVSIVLSGCATPLVVGSRRLPATLQYEPARFAKPPGPVARVPEVITQRLKNGVYFTAVHDPRAGLVDLSFIVRCGRVDDSPSEPAVSQLMLSSAFSAGAGKDDALTQRARLEGIGGAPDVHADDGETWGTFTLRQEDLPTAIELLADALATPHFEALPVRAALDGWASILEVPSAAAESVAFTARQGSVYALAPQVTKLPTGASLSSIQPDTLSARAAECLNASNVALAISGSVSPSELPGLLAPLEQLPQGPVKGHPAIPTNLRPRAVKVVTTRSDRVQVSLVGLGLPPGGNRAAAGALTELLESSIAYTLRDRGYIYGSQSVVDVGPSEGATWIHFSTRPDVAFEATRLAVELVSEWWSRWPFADYDLEAFKDRKARAGSSPFGLAFSEARAHLQDQDKFDATPYEERAKRLSKEDLRLFFVRAMRPDKLQVVVVGPVADSVQWQSLKSP